MRKKKPKPKKRSFAGQEIVPVPRSGHRLNDVPEAPQDPVWGAGFAEGGYHHGSRLVLAAVCSLPLLPEMKTQALLR